jgi:hypothetical protein
MIIPPKKMEIDCLITSLKNIGVIFYSRKNNMVYVADEIVKILRQIRGKEIADKYYRRVLKTFKEPQLNNICRKYNIDVKDLQQVEAKINLIIREGILFSNLLSKVIHKESANLTERKKYVNDVWENGLKDKFTAKGCYSE